MKAALLEDPVFNDLTALKNIDPHLLPDDRRVSMHKARRNHVGFGVNDLVELLYSRHSMNYERLHQSSIAVRYRTTPLLYKLEDIQKWAFSIKQTVDNDLMKYSSNWKSNGLTG